MFRKKLLQFLYGNLKYPIGARKDEIQEIGLIQFMIDKEGNVTKVNPFRGITKEIRAKCIRVIKKCLNGDLIINVAKW